MLSPGRRALILASLLVWGVGRSATPAAGPAEIPWSPQLSRALGTASKSNLPLLVDVWAVWCAPCKVLDETTYRDPGLIEAAAGFVPVKLDADVNKSFLMRHKVDAFPTILFLDQRGREIGRHQGLIAAEELISKLNQVRRGYAAYLEALDAEEDPEALATLGAYLLAAGNARAAVDPLRQALDSGPDPRRRERLELLLAEAQIDLGDTREALSTYARLAAEGTQETQGRALAGQVRLARELERPELEREALERLTREFPKLAAELVPAAEAPAP